jgi:hypothetical protein
VLWGSSTAVCSAACGVRILLPSMHDASPKVVLHGSLRKVLGVAPSLHVSAHTLAGLFLQYIATCMLHT